MREFVGNEPNLPRFMVLRCGVSYMERLEGGDGRGTGDLRVGDDFDYF